MLIVLGLNHRTAPVSLREQFAFAETSLPAALRGLLASGACDEAVILSTCNRVEVYAATSLEPRAAIESVKSLLLSLKGVASVLPGELYAYTEPQSLHHLFRVACGLDSMVLGETEILGQLKKAYECAVQEHATGKRLNKAFQRAFNTAKHVRSQTNIQRGSISVSSVAVELAEKIFAELTDRDVLVVGAGDTSEKAARALVSRGARHVIVTNRSFDRAEALAQTLGGRAVQFDHWHPELEKVDIVISSTSAPHVLLDRAILEPVMQARRGRELLLIDLAVPRDIEPEVNNLDDVYLYNVDDLQGIANDYLAQRKEEIAQCETIIVEKARPLLTPLPEADLGGHSQPAFR